MPSKKQNAVREIFKKMEETKTNEKIRISSRRKAQKKGKSIATQKSPKKVNKPIRQKRRVTKKRSSVR